MNPSTVGNSVVDVVSVKDLIDHKSSDSDRWNLALVQRDEVWDEVRMRQLVDSLLAGYPIGAILLSRLRPGASSGAREIVLHADGTRSEQNAEEGSWQILDGQQRINALYSVFTDRGRYGRFYLDMHASRPEPSPSQRRNSKARSLAHLRHVEPDDDLFDGREHWIDLSRWHGWASARPDLQTIRVDADNVTSVLAELDDGFTAVSTDEQARQAAINLNLLIQAWTRRAVPIVPVELDSALDVLEVFTRINLGGVNVAGDDVYFAGVKTHWRDAEQRMDAVLDAAPVLTNRIAALRLTSRLASRGIGHGDMLPVAVERLSGARGELLRSAMAELTETDAPVLARLSAFTRWYVEASRLGYVLRQVTPELWDDVLAWVATSERNDPEWFAASRQAIDTYLLGATLFGYRSVMRDAFRRLALVESMEAGRSGQDFPLERIIEATRAKTELRGSRGRRVLGLATPEDRMALARRGGWMLTALAQRIPYQWEPEDNFDWDHIFPQAQATRMWSPGSGSRRRHHPDRHLVNSTGNYWALKKSANRSLQDTVGPEKFRRLREWAQSESGWSVWEEGRWALTPQEIDSFIEVDRLLNGEPVSIDAAMLLFRHTTLGRSLRLLEEALLEYPDLALFAGDRVEKSDGSSPSSDYTAALSISTSDALLGTVSVEDAATQIKQRRHTLVDAIHARLDETHRVASSWSNQKTKRGETTGWIAFELEGGNCVELMPRWKAGTGALLVVKAYPKKGKPDGESLYPEFDHVPLPVPWSAPDAEVVAHFLKEVARVEELHPREGLPPATAS